MTGSQFAWGCLGGERCDPANGFAPPDPCWLCGGETLGIGWIREEWLPPTFTNHNLSAMLSSRAVCQACVALSSKSTWDAYVAAHPEKGLKTGYAMSWRFYSHVFVAGAHDCPTRSRWREWLLAPPAPPFLFCVATSGQKHLLFRCRVADSRDVFPVQFEEARLIVRRAEFADCLADFERGLAAGLRRNDLLTGTYNTRYALNAGLARWRSIECAIAKWRRSSPALLELAHRFATAPENTTEEAEWKPITDSTPTTSTPQLGLF